ncbi:UDP-2,4-diacetamido-2,4,6-trideoxy-beta-L-altropyranose hydrolase [Pandoraea sp. NE5]|uniref:UDP-2,4-diacetamido-2,4, 6-trideoxy-beta-L-altropyranose hydrolase n=1 Tax=unclassified Pandoraea TaxID=2624094 RepID=UPI00034B4B23|nr:MULTISPECIES: UDP-2,4-diacetamido-2,4,6-trideoxy-beta-L-altropyranose hydrolase [unclassified Pandoraea]BDD92215.1 UDP-2,4-diacetamido-2,4,6-trideoxy-beta-L-altropyranose hydrolase [Pandoraea sp. NE5]
MKVVIRADASIQIGSGHVMRCLTLADRLRTRGADVTFVGRPHPGHAGDVIAARGYAWLALTASSATTAAPVVQDSPDTPLAHARWLGVPWQTDLIETQQVLALVKPDWLVVDHYALDERWERLARTSAPRIMVIDDLADRGHDCDILLDQNFHLDPRRRYEGRVPVDCVKLLGPANALLRPAFLGPHPPRTIPDKIRRLLVFMGGVDADNVTGKVLDALELSPLRDVPTDVVLGANAPHLANVREHCAAMPQIRLHVQIDNMAELMAGADLAIGACGSATWERCALGLPTVVIVLADNQRPSANDLATAGFVCNLGDATDLAPDVIAREVVALAHDSTRRDKLSRASMALMHDDRQDPASLIFEWSGHAQH